MKNIFKEKSRTSQSSTSATTPDSSGGEFDIASSDYARKRSELMALAKALRGLGADAEIDLPSIVVIGNQSAGKSSLVEAVSGISVPRDSGTCTRCPMLCEMLSSATTWSCNITLRIDHDANGRLISPEIIPFVSQVTRKSDVDIFIRRAQAAILNRDLSASSFLNKSLEELVAANQRSTSLKFSKNAVCVEIQDPETTEISFFDLPGLVQNAEYDTVKLIKSLTQEYIQKEKALILVTIPMSDDMENQLAVQLSKQADNSGERTVGVLTKPDTIPVGNTGSQNNWIKVLEGQSHALKQGYYCVRLPNDEERKQNITRLDAQSIAAQYFERPPWNRVSRRDRFGIPALVADLSKLLMQMIEDSIPKLKIQVSKRLEECAAELALLPQPLQNKPAVEVALRIADFSTDLSHLVLGGGHNKNMIHINQAYYESYKRVIRGTAPDFRPFPDPENYTAHPSHYGGSDELAERSPAGSDNGGDESDESTEEEDESRATEIMGLFYVRNVIREEKAWELPHNIPFSAKIALIRKSTALWETPTLRCFEKVYQNLVEFLSELIHQHFGQFERLEIRVRDLIYKQLDVVKEKALQDVHKILKLEDEPQYTQNLHYLESTRVQWLSRYRHMREHPNYYKPFGGKPYDSIPAYRGKSHEDIALDALSSAGYNGLKREDLARLCPDARFEDEICVMAEVRAYFQVAYKRIVDAIPLTFEHSLNQALADDLKACLFEILSSNDTPEKMKELLSEDLAIFDRREELLTKQKRLKEMQEKLNNFRLD